MSSYEMIMSGFGGQGILFMGQMLSYAACDAGKKVSWLPSYGPEMRGGTCNCMTIIGDGEIYSPLVWHPDLLVAMNRPSLVRFEEAVKPGGVIILNKDMVDIPVTRTDVRQVWVPADQIAAELGNSKISNVAALGTLIGATGLLTLEEVAAAIEKKLPASKKAALAVNIEALKRGYEYGQKEE